MYIKTLEVAGIESALHGMRNPMNSWDKSDSGYVDMEDCYGDAFYNGEDFAFKIGENDLDLAQRLINGGSEHSKFMRQIQVWADFNMPRYWWSEFDTYHFNTKNSCSTMHRLLTESEITMDAFHLSETTAIHYQIITELNGIREMYLEAKAKKDNKEMTRMLVRAKQLLPESFLQMRTVNTNYAELRNMYLQRRHHRLKEEWVDTFCGWCATLPYFKEFISYGIE